MKRISSGKLSLHREVIRVLSNRELSAAHGMGGTSGCTAGGGGGGKTGGGEGNSQGGSCQTCPENSCGPRVCVPNLGGTIGVNDTGGGGGGGGGGGMAGGVGSIACGGLMP